MSGELKYARQCAVVLAGQYDAVSLNIERQLREKPGHTKAKKIMYPTTGDSDFKVSVGDLVFTKTQYGVLNQSRVNRTINPGQTQQPLCLSSLNGMMVDKVLFEQAPHLTDEENYRRIVKKVIRVIGMAQTHFEFKGHGQPHVQGIAVQTSGVLQSFNNGPDTFSTGDYVMWDVPMPGEKQYSHYGVEGDHPNRYRLRSVRRKNVCGLRVETLMSWVRSKISKPDTLNVNDFRTRLREAAKKDEKMTTAGAYMCRLAETQDKYNDIPCFKPFDVRSDQLHQLFQYDKQAYSNPTPFDKLKAALNMELAAAKEADIVLNSQVYGRVMNACTPGKPMAVNLFM